MNTLLMSPKELTADEKKRLRSTASYIMNHLHEPLRIEDLAKKALLSDQGFKDGFYQLFEMSAGSYMHEARMQTGKFLLLHSDKSIKEIASLCGFSKARNFSSAFKKFFGIRPSEQRE